MVKVSRVAFNFYRPMAEAHTKHGNLGTDHLKVLGSIIECHGAQAHCHLTKRHTIHTKTHAHAHAHTQ
jgi:hypothetical protein